MRSKSITAFSLTEVLVALSLSIAGFLAVVSLLPHLIADLHLAQTSARVASLITYTPYMAASLPKLSCIHPETLEVLPQSNSTQTTAKLIRYGEYYRLSLDQVKTEFLRQDGKFRESPSP